MASTINGEVVNGLSAGPANRSARPAGFLCRFLGDVSSLKTSPPRLRSPRVGAFSFQFEAARHSSHLHPMAIAIPRRAASIPKAAHMNFGISPAFEYVETAINWLWPAVAILAALGLGYIWGGCAQRG